MSERIDPQGLPVGTVVRVERQAPELWRKQDQRRWLQVPEGHVRPHLPGGHWTVTAIPARALRQEVRGLIDSLDEHVTQEDVRAALQRLVDELAGGWS